MKRFSLLWKDGDEEIISARDEYSAIIKACRGMPCRIEEIKDHHLTDFETQQMYNRLVDSVIGWWENHKHDTRLDSDGKSYNVFDSEPLFVTIAKEILKNMSGMTYDEVREKLKEIGYD